MLNKNCHHYFYLVSMSTLLSQTNGMFSLLPRDLNPALVQSAVYFLSLVLYGQYYFHLGANRHYSKPYFTFCHCPFSFYQSMGYFLSESVSKCKHVSIHPQRQESAATQRTPTSSWPQAGQDRNYDSLRTVLSCFSPPTQSPVRTN